MKSKNLISAVIAAIALIGGFGLYSYYSPAVWLKDIKKASEEGDRERLRDLIDFDLVKTDLKEDIKSQMVVSMGTGLQDNPFAALGIAMASMMVDPMVDMIVSPSGIAALVARGQVQPPSKEAKTSKPTSNEDKSSHDNIKIERGYDSFSRYRIRIRSSDKHAEAPIILTLKREGLFSWKLSRISLPSNLLSSTNLPQRPDQIGIEASDLQVIDTARPELILFTATLRNRAGHDVGFPALDLTLTDANQHTLARRIFAPNEYLARDKDVPKGFSTSAEITIRLNLDTGNLNPSGFRLDLISPEMKGVKELQLNPEKIQIVEIHGKPKTGRSIPTPASTDACLEWGAFAGPNIAKAESALAQLRLSAGQVEQKVTDVGGYWVYLPPLKSKADTDVKARELRDLGITQFFVVQEPAQWRNTISLGIFSTENAAQMFLANVKKRGVKNATMVRREEFLKQIVFYIREPNEATVSRLAQIQTEFPDSEIKATPCPIARRN